MNMQLSGRLGYCLLKALSRRSEDAAVSTGNELHGAAKLERFLGRNVWGEFQGQRILDFGCGAGEEAVAVALRGAAMVVGTDIQDERLAHARQRATEAGVADRCRFLHAVEQAGEIAACEGSFDCAYSIDAFEHFSRPGEILRTLHQMLTPGGRLLVSFGPPWKNPFGSHTHYFCRWPWMHLLFSEATMLAVRSHYRHDGAKCYAEVEGGLNQMTLARFASLVEASPLRLDTMRAVPLSSRFVDSRGVWKGLFTNRFLREYFTSVVQCRLVKPRRAAHVNHAVGNALRGIPVASVEP